MLQEFITFLESQVSNGSIYVLGAQGQTGALITEAWIKQREHNIKSNYTRAIAFWKKQLDKGYTALRAYDCSGLAMYKLTRMGLFSGDLTAHGMYSKCDPVTRDQLKVGDWAFRKNSVGRKYHIGYVVAMAETPIIIECKGRDDGVVKRGINASGATYWNCYGRPRIFKTEIETVESEETDVLKKGDKNDSVKAWQMALNAQGANLDEDGDFGSLTEAATNVFRKAHGLAETGVVDIAASAAMWMDGAQDADQVMELTSDVTELTAKIAKAAPLADALKSALS